MAAKEPTVEWPPREPTEAQLAAARNLRAAFLRCDNYEEEIACLWPVLAAAEQAAERAWDEGYDEGLMRPRGAVNPYRQPKGPTK